MILLMNVVILGDKLFYSMQVSGLGSVRHLTGQASQVFVHREDFVCVHVGAGAGTTLDGIHDELAIELAVSHLDAGSPDWFEYFSRKFAKFKVCCGRSLFDVPESPD